MRFERQVLQFTKVAEIVGFPLRLLFFSMAFLLVAAMGQLRTAKDVDEIIRDFFPKKRTA